MATTQDEMVHGLGRVYTESWYGLPDLTREVGRTLRGVAPERFHHLGAIPTTWTGHEPPRLRRDQGTNAEALQAEGVVTG